MIQITPMGPSVLPGGLGRLIGAEPSLPGEEPARPRTLLGWALHWASRGVFVFPAKAWLGSPLIERWYAKATLDAGQIVDWWSEWPDADIGAVPFRSDRYVIAACGRIGLRSLEDLEDKFGELEPVMDYETRWGDRHLWFNGDAVISSRNHLGPSLHVCGPGCKVFMPPSLAIDPDTDTD